MSIVLRRRNTALFNKHFDPSEVQGLGETLVMGQCVVEVGVRKEGRGSHTATQGAAPGQEGRLPNPHGAPCLLFLTSSAPGTGQGLG